jgi:hypothetical protein
MQLVHNEMPAGYRRKQERCTCPKTDHLQFGHVHKHNNFFMTSAKTQINFYHPSMTRIILTNVIPYL